MLENKVIGEVWENVPRLPPDLQSLVVEHGGYDRIDGAGWAKFHAEMMEWQAMIRNGEHHVKRPPPG
jgi:hypothetical protein